MKHPDAIEIALYAGDDLGFWERLRIRRHVAHCPECRSDVEAVAETRSHLRQTAPDLPSDMNWNRLADEMTGNIRVGLAAGQAIARFDRGHRIVKPHRLGWNASMVLACATVMFAAAFWLSLPREQADHLMASLRRIRFERLGTQVHGAVATSAEGVVLEASQSAIEVKENGGAMSLMNPHASGTTTVSFSMQGSAGVRYIDADSGQVTINKVYYAQP